MKLSIILVISFEKPQLVSDALAAVFASRTDFRFEVIVVDNASTAAATALAPFAARLQVIRNRENLGFTKANNRGVAAAQGEYLLFLNSDTRIGPDTLSLLVGFADAHPHISQFGQAKFVAQALGIRHQPVPVQQPEACRLATQKQIFGDG